MFKTANNATNTLRISIRIHTPNVASQHGGLALSERIACIVSTDNFELVVVVTNQPDPTRAEVVDGFFLELLLELVEAAKGSIDRIGNLASGSIATLRAQGLPVECVVPDLK